MNERGEVTKAVILARGLGTRMRREDRATALHSSQSAVADTGMKAMIPIGRPFLDYVISALADAGFTDVCLVIGPEHDAIRDYYATVNASRVHIDFAVQEHPLGTADAVLAAEPFAAGEPFLVLNADNYYPVQVLAQLRAYGRAALPGFDPDALVRLGNIPAERLAAFAIVESTDDGMLQRIVEKPPPEMMGAPGRLISMNAWLFTSEIFHACRSIGLSPRGELELQSAVQHLVDQGEVGIRVIPVSAPVLDLSSRSDIPAVTEQLAETVVRL
jgi:dTDP-glucose pyrophosphorylase